jgi:hypothetical protein
VGVWPNTESSAGRGGARTRICSRCVAGRPAECMPCCRCVMRLEHPARLHAAVCCRCPRFVQGQQQQQQQQQQSGNAVHVTCVGTPDFFDGARRVDSGGSTAVLWGMGTSGMPHPTNCCVGRKHHPKGPPTPQQRPELLPCEPLEGGQLHNADWAAFALGAAVESRPLVPTRVRDPFMFAVAAL